VAALLGCRGEPSWPPSWDVGANPRGRPLGQVQGLPLPRFIEKIPILSIFVGIGERVAEITMRIDRDCPVTETVRLTQAMGVIVERLGKNPRDWF